MTIHNTTTDTGSPTKEQPQKNRLILSGLSDKQRTGLKTGSIGLLGLIGGATAIGLLSSSKISANPSEDADTATTEGTDDTTNNTDEVLVVETDAEVAVGNFDGMSFGDAFAAAREQVGAGGFFEWNGASYNTYYAEEWDTMSEVQKNDYASNLQSNSDFQNGTIVKRTEVINTKDSYDLNNDGNPDVTMQDLDGDGIKEVYEVDLNSDGNIDVIHDAAQPVAMIEEDVIDPNDINIKVSVEVNGVEQAMGLSDLSEVSVPMDGEFDGSFVVAESQEDAGGYAETVLVDKDTVIEDVIEGEELDIYIVDEGADEIEDDAIEIVEDELNMDDFTIVEDAPAVEAVEELEINEDSLKTDDFDIESMDF